MTQRSRSALLLLLAGTVGGCADVSGPAPEASANLFACLFGGAGTPEVGEVVETSGAATQTFCVGGGTEGADYLLVPFLAAEEASARLVIDIGGAGVRPAVGPPTPSLSAEPGGLRLGDAAHHHGTDFHAELRRREARELTPLLPRAREAMAMRDVARERTDFAAAPQVGETLQLRAAVVQVPDGAVFEFGGCSRFSERPARVEAVSQTAIVAADLNNPPGGFTRADYESFALSFDTLVHPLMVRHFDQPTDIDGNGRVIIFFTRAVNELSPPGSPGIVGGFFWSGDLLPRAQCPASNEAEIFYQLVPDPQGAVGNVRTTASVRDRTVGVLGHEYQHLINAGRRIYVNNAQSLEEVWLNEALSHVAEELLFYQAAGLGPRRNLTLQALTSSPVVLDAINRYGVQNLARFLNFLEQPDTISLLGVDNLPTRGAGWAFLRYAVDQSGRPDEQVLRSLVNARNAGLANLRTTLNTDPLALMQAWTVSVYVDDAVPGIAARYQQPSWNFRSVMPGLIQQQRFPLAVQSVPSDGTQQVTLRAGGAAYLRFGVGAGAGATIQIRSGGQAPPERLRLSLVRTR
jgi:hypothetical protein